MTTAEIRTKLIEERTRYQSDLAASEAACKEIETVLGNLDDETIGVMSSYGFDLAWLKAIDLEKLKADPDYCKSIQLKLEKDTTEIHSFLEEQLKDV